MAQITLTISDAIAPRVLDAVAAGYGYIQAEHGTKTQFLRLHLRQYLKEIVVGYEAGLAATAAAQQARTAAESEIDIT
jgi:hypothetical protein